MDDDINPLVRAMSEAIVVDRTYRQLLDSEGNLRDRDWPQRWVDISAHADDLSLNDWLALYRASRQIPEEDRPNDIEDSIMDQICSLDKSKLSPYACSEIIEAMDGYPSGPYSVRDSALAGLALQAPDLSGEEVETLCFIIGDAIGYDFHDESMEFEDVIHHPHATPDLLMRLFTLGSMEAGKQLCERTPGMTVNEIIACDKARHEEKGPDSDALLKVSEDIYLRWLCNPRLIDDMGAWARIKESYDFQFDGLHRDLSIRDNIHTFLHAMKTTSNKPLIPEDVISDEDRAIANATYRADWEDSNGTVHPLVCKEGRIRCGVHDSRISYSMQLTPSGDPECRGLIDDWKQTLAENPRTIFREGEVWGELGFPIAEIRQVAQSDFANAIGVPIRVGVDLLNVAPEWLGHPDLALDWMHKNLTPNEQKAIEKVTGKALSPAEIALF